MDQAVLEAVAVLLSIFPHAGLLTCTVCLNSFLHPVPTANENWLWKQDNMRQTLESRWFQGWGARLDTQTHWKHLGHCAKWFQVAHSDRPMASVKTDNYLKDVIAVIFSSLAPKDLTEKEEGLFGITV